MLSFVKTWHFSQHARQRISNGIKHKQSCFEWNWFWNRSRLKKAISPRFLSRDSDHEPQNDSFCVSECWPYARSDHILKEIYYYISSLRSRLRGCSALSQGWCAGNEIPPDLPRGCCVFVFFFRWKLSANWKISPEQVGSGGLPVPSVFHMNAGDLGHGPLFMAWVRHKGHADCSSLSACRSRWCPDPCRRSANQPDEQKHRVWPFILLPQYEIIIRARELQQCFSRYPQSPLFSPQPGKTMYNRNSSFLIIFPFRKFFPL